MRRSVRIASDLKVTPAREECIGDCPMIKRIAFAAALVLAVATVPVRTAPPPGEWRSYAADKASTRYTALDQINASNVGKLRVAWRQSATPEEVKVGRSNVPPPF